MSARNHWIGVVSRSHVRLGVEGGFIQPNHRKKAPLQPLHAGEGLLIYSPTTAYSGGEVLQAFTAVGSVKWGDVYQVEMRPGFKPYRVDVEFLPCAEAPIRPLIDRLSFTRSKTHWGADFRFGRVKVLAADYVPHDHPLRSRCAFSLRIDERPEGGHGAPDMARRVPAAAVGAVRAAAAG